MCLPPGRPAHPSRLESYFKWTASKEGEGLLWKGGGGIIFGGFLIQEVKLAGAPAGERQGGEGGEGWRSGRGWYRWTVYKGQRCHWRALHLLCQLPWFSHLQERAEGRGGLGSRCWQALWGLAEGNVLYLNNKSSFSCTVFYSISSDTICNVEHIPGNCLWWFALIFIYFSNLD